MTLHNFVNASGTVERDFFGEFYNHIFEEIESS